MNLEISLVWLHISGLVAWIGAIIAVGKILAAKTGDGKTRGEIALGIYRQLAVPAFLVAFLAGATRLFMDPKYYLKEHHWMHAKLPLALAVIAIHHVIGARAKKMAHGTVQDAGPTATLTIVLALCAVGAAFFAVSKLPN